MTEETVKTEKKVRSNSRKAAAESMEMFKLILKIVTETSESKSLVPRCAKPYITELQKRLDFETPEQASLLTAL